MGTVATSFVTFSVQAIVTHSLLPFFGGNMLNHLKYGDTV